MRQFAVDTFEKEFPSKGALMETVIYDNVKSSMYASGNRGMDFYPFRLCYKRKLQSVLLNLKKDNFKTEVNSCKDEQEIKDLLTAENKEWQRNLWAMETNTEGVEDVGDDELREGTFDCGNCARKGLYSRNTSHYEKQTRSADEPMTIFMHCHTCGKDYRFSS